jgi:hypothetical protein
MSDTDARNDSPGDYLDPAPGLSGTADTEDGALSPGSTATGAGTTEADVTDGREQKLPRVD